MPNHTDLHKEAAADEKTRQLGLKRQRDIRDRKATEEAKKKEKEDRGVTKVNKVIKIPVIPFQGERDWSKSSQGSGG
tara:strand:+ start:411 stop:641 length:231 start_codon:yes stop_codon:yes gene_type:complete